MKIKHIIAAFMAAATLSAAVPMSIYAEQSAETTSTDTSEEPSEPQTEAVTYKVTFLDFDGKPLKVVEVSEGAPIDYSSVDTSVLRKHLDKYTEQEFLQWNVSPETADSDLTIRALYRKATISFGNEPQRHRYVYAEGDIDTTGLKVSITIESQLPETDDSGAFRSVKNTIDISESCTVRPGSLAEAFADGKNEAVIEIVPLGDTKALAAYNIELVSDIGDVTRDGKIDAIDASAILRAYADLNSDSHKEISADIKKYGDINDDGVIDATDASFVLRYYVLYSANKSPDWREIAGIK